MPACSEQRRFLNEVLLEPYRHRAGGLVYDIGKSQTWDYQGYFTRWVYRTVDRDPALRPDIVHDLEDSPLPALAELVIFNGVFEQCSDPWALMRNLRRSIAPEGTLIAGLASIGMPPYGERDKWRLTLDGARAYLADWTIRDMHIFPEYFYAICQPRN